MLISIGRYVRYMEPKCLVPHLPATSSPQNVPAFIEAVKRREKTLSGFGHRYVISCLTARSLRSVRSVRSLRS